MPCPSFLSLQPWFSITAQLLVAMPSLLLKPSRLVRESEPPSPRPSSSRRHMRLDIISVTPVGFWIRLSGKAQMYFYSIPKARFDNSLLLLCRYPIVFPRERCAGDLGNEPGVRSYGLRPADERYDVYCYIDRLKGETGH